MNTSPIHSLAAATLLMLSTSQVFAGPQIEHWIMDNGARVYFVSSTALPLIDIQVDFAAGSAYDPQNKAGLAGLTFDLLQSGTDKMNEQTIADSLADTGGQLSTSTDLDRSSLSIRTLSSKPEREAIIGLATDLLTNPTFPPNAVQREKARSIAALKEALTRPSTLTDRRFNEAIYSGHPYGRSPDVTSLERITQSDLVNFHQRFVVTKNATITIVGDVTRADAEGIANTLMAGLPAGQAAPALPQPGQPEALTEHISNPSAQAHIQAGMPGMTRDDPDYFPLLVGNYILGGGGFVSRLMVEVREKRGFAYSVYSYFMPNRVAGPFVIGLQTRGSQAEDAIAVVRDVLQQFVSGGPTDEELNAAKDNLVNGFGLRLDSNAKIAGYVSMIGFYQLPPDWLDTYLQHVKNVTNDQIRDAFQRRVRKEHLVIISAGGDGDVHDTAE